MNLDRFELVQLNHILPVAGLRGLIEWQDINEFIVVENTIIGIKKDDTQGMI